jgi:hypothetical protein
VISFYRLDDRFIVSTPAVSAFNNRPPNRPLVGLAARGRPAPPASTPSPPSCNSWGSGVDGAGRGGARWGGVEWGSVPQTVEVVGLHHANRGARQMSKICVRSRASTLESRGGMYCTSAGPPEHHVSKVYSRERNDSENIHSSIRHGTLYFDCSREESRMGLVIKILALNS